jgi:hypothetical protein
MSDGFGFDALTPEVERDASDRSSSDAKLYHKGDGWKIRLYHMGHSSRVPWLASSNCETAEPHSRFRGNPVYPTWKPL